MKDNIRVIQLINDRGNPVANQFIIESKDTTAFQSYESIVAVIKNRKLTLGRDWDYSITTLKHLYTFLCDNRSRLNDTYVTGLLFKGVVNKKVLQQLIDEELIDYDENLR